jgi:hypothetical protein
VQRLVREYSSLRALSRYKGSVPLRKTNCTYSSRTFFT